MREIGSRMFPMPSKKMQSQWPKTFKDGTEWRLVSEFPVCCLLLFALSGVISGPRGHESVNLDM